MLVCAYNKLFVVCYETHMPEKEVCSPVSRPGSKVGSGQPMSPGARSNPSRGRSDSLPQQHSHARVSRDAEEPAALKIMCPEE
jgi:hypothetical protein